MSKLKIKCELFEVKTDGERIISKNSDAMIIGKTIYISNLIDGFVFNDNYKYSYPFNYSFDIPIDDIVTLNQGRKKGKINTLLTCHKDNIPYCYYIHLTWWQKWIVKKYFDNLWLQQASNIMWIVNVLVAIMAIIATMLRK